MTCKLVEETKVKTIPMCELPDGKLGVIMKTTEFAEGQIGEIIQRSGRGGFVSLGSRFIYLRVCKYMVRVLEEGELIEVKYS